MTNEEAIRVLNVARAECEWSAPLEYQEAFDMAIEALRKSLTSVLGTSDVISRQAAIDAINEYMVGKRCDTDGTMMARLINELVIQQLPPVQLSTNLAEVGTDCISREQAIEARYDK